MEVKQNGHRIRKNQLQKKEGNTMTEEDKKFKDFSDKILSELESQENITFEDLVKKALEVNPVK